MDYQEIPKDLEGFGVFPEEMYKSVDIWLLNEEVNTSGCFNFCIAPFDFAVFCFREFITNDVIYRYRATECVKVVDRKRTWIIPQDISIRQRMKNSYSRVATILMPLHYYLRHMFAASKPWTSTAKSMCEIAHGKYFINVDECVKNDTVAYTIQLIMQSEASIKLTTRDNVPNSIWSR
jgi:hypothetical protein